MNATLVNMLLALSGGTVTYLLLLGASRLSCHRK